MAIAIDKQPTQGDPVLIITGETGDVLPTRVEFYFFGDKIAQAEVEVITK